MIRIGVLGCAEIAFRRFLPELVKKSMRFYCLEGQREPDEKEKYEMYILFSYMKEDKRTKNTDLLVKSISNY